MTDPTPPFHHHASSSSSQSDLQQEVASMLANLLRNTAFSGAEEFTAAGVEEGVAGGEPPEDHPQSGQDQEEPGRLPMTSVGDSSTRMSRRVHGSGDADVEALTVGLTHSLSRVVQEATGRLVEVKQRLYQEQEDRVTEALRQHEAKLGELQAYIDVLRGQLHHQQVTSQQAEEKNEVVQDRLASRLHARESRAILLSAFQQWRWSVFATITVRAAQDHAAKQLDQQRQKSRALVTWTHQQAQAKIQHMETNQRSRADQIAHEIVKKYEEELSRVRQLLALREDELAYEIKRREHIQDEARRAFLKTMTSLNLEALSVFGTGASTTSPTTTTMGLGSSSHNRVHGLGSTSPRGHTEEEGTSGFLPPPDERPRPPLAVQPTCTAHLSV